MAKKKLSQHNINTKKKKMKSKIEQHYFICLIAHIHELSI